MYPLALCLTLVSLLALSSLVLPGNLADRAQIHRARCEAVADNFLLFCSAARLALDKQAAAHATGSPDHSADLSPAASLTLAQVEQHLPPGYVALGSWQIASSEDRVCVYGPPAAGSRHELLAFHVRRKLDNARTAGQCRSSHLHPAGIALPDAIPEGSVVCVLAPRQ